MDPHQASFPDLRRRLASDGFAVVGDVVDRVTIDRLVAALDRSGDAYAMRDVFRVVPETVRLLSHPRLAALVAALFGRPAFAVRCLFFDKVAGHNWPVAWHQDTVIAVKQRIETPGFGPWSIKAGVTHVRAPASVLQGMLAVRLHLDDCPAANGALRCAPGSDRLGVLDEDQIRRVVDRAGAVTCEARAGDVVLMKPLTLHASSPAVTPSHRRVLHIEVACDDLPGPLCWHERRLFGFPRA